MLLLSERKRVMNTFPNQNIAKAMIQDNSEKYLYSVHARPVQKKETFANLYIVAMFPGGLKS